MKTVRAYGGKPHNIALLHGGPGAPGEMKPVAKVLSKDFGVLECLQTKNSVNEQIEELNLQLNSYAALPAVIIGYSWGAWLGFMFAASYPAMVRKLILISSGAFEKKYNHNLMKIRLSRLNAGEKEETEKLIFKINTYNFSSRHFKRFGELMSKADSFDLMPDDNKVKVDFGTYSSVWKEASALRDSNTLLSFSSAIKCPVVAIHGTYDPHPYEGVEKPLSENLTDFKMILLDNCGHTPWREKLARDYFFELLAKELI